MITLSIDPEKVRTIIDGARAFDAKDGAVDPESGSNPVDDEMVDVLEDTDQDSTYEQLLEAIRGMDLDVQVDLVTLAWIGRGTFTPHEWAMARTEALGAHNNHTAEYLTSLPMLGDYLEEGLEAVIEDEDEEGEE